MGCYGLLWVAMGAVQMSSHLICVLMHIVVVCVFFFRGEGVLGCHWELLSSE